MVVVVVAMVVVAMVVVALRGMLHSVAVVSYDDNLMGLEGCYIL